MNQLRLALLLGSLILPAVANAAPPDGPDGNPPPPPPPPSTCIYSDHSCQVTSPGIIFGVNKINGIVPSSMNDCELLPPCGHRPPPPTPPHAGMGNPPPPPPMDDGAPPPRP